MKLFTKKMLHEDYWEEVKKLCEKAKMHLMPYPIEGKNRAESEILSISGSVKYTCKDCIGETVFKGKKAYCKNRNCDLPTCDNFKHKEKKHFRPFNDYDELIEYFVKFSNGISRVLFKPLIWVRNKEYGTENLITAFDNDNKSCVCIQDMWCNMAELFERYTFLDGSPCGVGN